MTHALEQSKRSKEVEVTLRMKFEERLNHLHSLNRSFREEADRNKVIVEDQAVGLAKLESKVAMLKDKLETETATRSTAEFLRDKARESLQGKNGELMVKGGIIDRQVI